MINKKFRSDLAEKQRQNEKQYLDSLTIKFMVEKLELLPGAMVYGGHGSNPKPHTLRYIFTKWVEARGDVVPKGGLAVKNSFKRAISALDLSPEVFTAKYRNRDVYKGFPFHTNVGRAIVNTESPNQSQSCVVETELVVDPDVLALPNEE
jgi:hypothetical protein